MNGVDHIAGRTFHGRRGDIRNSFSYGIDYVLLDAEAECRGPALFGRNALRLMGLRDCDHGGPPGAGRGAAWVREVLARQGIDDTVERIELMAQPRVLGHAFNPVSFWLLRDVAGALRAVIAEVTNTFGDRHSYLCRHPDLRPIDPHDKIDARKIFHVSPFQDVAGAYTFTFDIDDEHVDIVIDYRGERGRGVVATLKGPRRPLTNGAILWSALSRPLGSRRVLGLIHWQAVKLWWKGARYRPRPQPPDEEMSGGQP